ncbi:MurR/RpiR family transcriptional regulator [Wenjunlia tyrosinilytica]|uniref:RpiR family transcriptional regulator n=1 Tax=Wenjunlia tyrosinilytica TaxID=1544741 RepID=A0A917ZSX1_9ACTN|nr:MurR/RpiR family transcriptional regulator [Wenjunlia tyrosinilytica]GGO91654.1 RpiR family transcriptional regulator [Wenjunlia tyrosinilytica]
MSTQDGPSEAGLLARVSALRPTFSEALDQVAGYVLKDPAGASRITITELASRVGTSPGTVTRFCRAAGFSGYQELKVALAEEVGRGAQNRWKTDIGRAIEEDDSLEHVMQVVLAANSRALQETAAQMDLGIVDSFAQALVGARQAHFFGIGTSGVAAEELRLRLQRIKVPCWAWQDVHNGLIAAALLGNRDVAVGISHSGRVTETLEFLTEAARRGATTVAITSDALSPLADVAELVLTTSAQATALRSDALAARHSQLLILDVVYARIAQLTHERTLSALEVTAEAVTAHRTPQPRNKSRRAPRGNRPAPASPP